MVIQQDQDNSRAVAPAVAPSHSRAVASVELRRVERGGLLAGHRRSVCAVLAVAAWAATSAAVIGGGRLGRGAAIQITLAASMAAAALGETLLSRSLADGRGERSAEACVSWVCSYNVVVVAAGSA